MFKFDFEVEEEENSDLQLDLPGPSSPRQPAQGVGADQGETSQPKAAQPCHHVSLDDLLDTLPEAISYSPLYVPGLVQPVLRRDLFDMRFQLTQKDKAAAEGKDAAGGPDGDDEDYVDSSTDLVPGLYEGGLKTWEGGVDLVEVLSTTENVSDWVDGARVIEVGCGTAIPSAYLVSSLFTSKPPAASAKTIFHLQDFNKPVLELVSLPNLLLALLPHTPPEALRENDPESNEIEEVLVDITKPGILTITETVKTAFKDLLAQRNVELRFTYGHWSGLAESIQEEGRYDLVLTSETIYAEESVDDLLAVLRASYRGEQAEGRGRVEVGLEESLDSMRLSPWKTRPLRDGSETVILIAAKVLYFGVGGGVQDFLRKVERGGGWHESVKDWVTGVGRTLVRVGW
ncbi:hypothetical protein DB88DRAFT_501389 [Papiliotrema laurentii]|uniref:protein-histidine N-methyltransferase n=1 Tax=Papiliotrema laurentii TaxID=5418 RepID=A0AAD9CSW3_PAPLA|nr:hypothetical protein DB88DRAFT_501389 [Papiliotrema laurentii]